MKKKILVTGAKGFVGEHWCKYLIAKGYKVDAVDIKENNKSINSKNYTYYKKTIFDKKFLEKIGSKKKLLKLIQDSQLLV